MKTVIIRQAAEELNDAIEYYEEKHAGLGLRMMDEIDKHIQWIQDNVKTPRIHKGGYRRVNLKIFPYYIAYMFHKNILWILAIAHNHRKPEYWIDRKKHID